MKILNDPIDIIIQVVEKLYGKIDVDIYYSPKIRKFLWFGYCGVTIFSNNKPIILLSENLSMKHLPEIFAHEISHVIAGVEHGHDKIWENIFSKIHEEYYIFLNDKFFKKENNERFKR